jgi:hypothetical protein
MGAEPIHRSVYNLYKFQKTPFNKRDTIESYEKPVPVQRKRPIPINRDYEPPR